MRAKEQSYAVRAPSEGEDSNAESRAAGKQLLASGSATGTGTGAVRGASIPTQPAILHAQPRPDEMKASADGYCQGNKQKNLKLEHQTTGSGTNNVLSLQG